MKRFFCLLLLLAGTAGCAAAAAPTIALESITFAPELQVDLSAMERTRTGVYVRDLVEGNGPRVRRGSRVTAYYAGFLPDGTRFERVAPPTPAVEFQVGARSVIPGWESGLIGMRAGGQRQLVIPAAQAYGARGAGAVPPHANLVFVIELASVR